ncbi:MAG: hypothetical protein H3C62_03330 [Gemmatimonadaceae bacterium]|nr:hypothetical protein [Gemmatimonadaceae bacterium]
MNKSAMIELDICTKFITLAPQKATRDESQISEEVSFTKGRIIVRTRSSV